MKTDIDIIKDIVLFTHNGNADIVETSDFIDGVYYTLKYLSKLHNIDVKISNHSDVVEWINELRARYFNIL